MEPPSPLFVLKKSVESVTDLKFWNGFPEKVIECEKQNPSHLLAGYTNQGGVDIWNLSTRRVQHNIPSNHGIVSVCGNSFGEIVTLNREGELKLFAFAKDTMKLNSQITVPNVAFCKASHLFFVDAIFTAVTGEETSSISVWDFRKTHLLWRLIPVENSMFGMVMCIKLFEKASRCLFCLAGYENGSISLWNVKAESTLCNITLYDNVPIMCLDINLDSMFGIAGSPTEIITKFEIKVDDKSEQLSIAKTRKLQNEGIADIKIRPDNKIIAAGGWHDGSVRIFSSKTLKLLAILKYHDGTVQSLAFYDNPDSTKQILASGSESHKIAIWKIYNN